MLKALAKLTGWNAGKGLRDAFATIGENFQLLEPSVRATGAASATLKAEDRVISRTSAAAQTIGVPTNASVAIDIGQSFLVEQTGAGQLTIQPAAGVTVNRLAGRSLVAAGQFAMIRLTKIGTNVWNATGDLGA